MRSLCTMGREHRLPNGLPTPACLGILQNLRHLTETAEQGSRVQVIEPRELDKFPIAETSFLPFIPGSLAQSAGGVLNVSSNLLLFVLETLEMRFESLTLSCSHNPVPSYTIPSGGADIPTNHRAQAATPLRVDRAGR